MTNSSAMIPTVAEKRMYIEKLTSQLTLLRTKADVSQEDLAGVIGVSRQTYGAIERRSRKMTWNMYLSLILFFDYNSKTHNMIRSIAVFPTDFIKRITNDSSPLGYELDSFFSSSNTNIIGSLDDQALQAIRTMIMVEYARCTGMSAEAVIKAFDGINFVKGKITPRDEVAARALRSIRETR